MCQFLYFYYMTGTQKFLYSFELSNLLKELLFTFAVTFLVSNLTFLFFEIPVTNWLLKLFNLSRRRDIIANKPEKRSHSRTNHKKPEAIKYDSNNNNPDFKPINKID